MEFPPRSNLSQLSSTTSDYLFQHDGTGLHKEEQGHEVEVEESHTRAYGNLLMPLLDSSKCQKVLIPNQDLLHYTASTFS